MKVAILIAAVACATPAAALAQTTTTCGEEAGKWVCKSKPTYNGSFTTPDLSATFNSAYAADHVASLAGQGILKLVPRAK